MRRGDFERRRLRDLYERNVRRVRALADARDGRRSGRDDDIAAPRRYVVSERRTRLEGFGRGGYQVQRSRRFGRDPRIRRFSDRGVYRRGALDRFEREEDFERKLRRERFRERRLNEGGLRFGRLRLRRSERRELRQLRELRELRELRALRSAQRNQGNGDRRGKLDKELDRYRKDQRGGRRGGGGRGRGAPNSVTKEGLDAELDRFRGGN
ncbi:hypothetical protein C3747_41g135 [Trypanosoma cruzi]|uniref:Chromatin target of PRMT1 protein C-terminal domain-containing protein n=2 Tax=Trypanosoma cruzi TaxID=5693 RepID=Q4D9F7_TRYCC|nr:hypothetical protein, conserved [Trypanosoma cruzi]EAN89163.1 hypothetical protein, conserved [Trypanosoma cruzi]PWV13843.1 hypothetical protein C3747_41g135 [Trypanosoma cruzi]RNC44980.1 hypothetical protein TcCL_NonESM05310 [Trypanosoma cruzi]|eukprot:XP_811014.1 hypothetical protein [Trypanosoma cruzi strain CL Brener]